MEERKEGDREGCRGEWREMEGCRGRGRETWKDGWGKEGEREGLGGEKGRRH